MEIVAFFLFSFITILCAVMVIIARKLIYKAYFLLFSLLGIAAIFVLGRADFVAASQIMIYAGGILILIVFSLLFTGETHQETLPFSKFSLLKIFAPTLLASLGIIWLLQQVDFQQLHKTNVATIAPSQNFTTIKIIGTELLTNYLVPLEFVGILLLVVLAGVALLNSKQE